MNKSAIKTFVLWSVIALLSGEFASAAEPARNGKAIREVLSGGSAEAKASWWGFDPVDATEALQSAINSKAKRVIVENVGKPWIVNKIQLAGDQEVLFEPGVVVLAKRGAFKGGGDSLFTAALKKNIALVGYGATLKMWKADYQGDEYQKAEWRHAINIRSCSNVRVCGLTLAESGGDGIYLGVAQAGVTNKGVHIKDVVCDKNHRQGISVISAEDLLVENCVLRNTSGTAPQAGIDFEPNRPDEKLVRCVMRNCVTENNQGDGYEFYLKNLTGASELVSIRIENCRSVGDRRCAVRWVARNNHPDGPTRGSAEFLNCTFQGSGQPGVLLADSAASACKLRFEGCNITNVAVDAGDVSPITFSSGPDNTEDIGGVEFADCLVSDPVDRTPMTMLDWTGSRRVVDVTGTLVVRRRDDRLEYELNDRTLAEWMPWLALKRIPRFETAGRRFEPVHSHTPEDGYPMPPWRQRQWTEYLLFAEAGQEAEFVVQVIPVGSSGKSVPVEVTAPSGVQVREMEAPSGRETEYSIAADQTGAYRIVCQPGGATVRVGSKNHRICTFSDKVPSHFFGASGEFFFWVPPGVREFGIKVTGGNLGERLKAALCDPSGKVVEQKDNIARPHLFALNRDDVSRGEVWSFTVSRPTEGVLEDWYVELLGVPPVLSRSPQALLKPVD